MTLESDNVTQNDDIDQLQSDVIDLQDMKVMMNADIMTNMGALTALMMMVETNE